MLLFCDLFLEKQAIQDIRNQLIQYPDNDQRRQLCNKIVQLLNPLEKQLSHYDSFLKKSSDFTMIDLRDLLSQQELIFQKPIKIQFKTTDNKQCLIVIVYKEDEIRYQIPLQLQENQQTEVCLSEEKITQIQYWQNEYFEIVKMNIQLDDDRQIQFVQHELSPNIVLKEKTFRLIYEMINFHVLFQEELFAGFFVVYDCKNLQIDNDELRQQYIMPYEYDIDQFYGCQLRFDISLFNKQQFDKYNNSISLIKYDLESYQQKSNQVMQFLESVFPNCSGYVNFIQPQKIGDFSVYLMGVAHGCSDINKQTNNEDSNFFLFKNKKINHFPLEEELYDQFCYLLAKTGQIKLLQDKQSQFLLKKSIQTQPGAFEQIEEEKIDQTLYITTKKQNNGNSQVVCSNYGCGTMFFENENESCNGHDGTWDFGHTGISITETLQEYKKKKSKKILWKPHWSCCGQGWQQQCSKIHNHNGIDPQSAKNVELDFENPDLQRIFKKKVRESWNQQVDKFHKFTPGQIKKKILHFAQKCYIKDQKQIPIEKLPELCDQCHMHILVISDDMSYHFKFLDLVNGKAFEYLKTEDDYIDIDKFQQWWFCSLKELNNFKQINQ